MAKSFIVAFDGEAIWVAKPTAVTRLVVTKAD